MFGQPAAGASPFGAPATNTPFGAPAPAFGTPAAAPAPAFGAPAPATGGFGFGSPAPAPATSGFGGFGSAAPAPAPTTGFGGFGSPAPAPVSAFGAPAAASTTPFGSPAPAPSGGLFGAAPTPAPATGGLFGAPTPAPTFGAAAPAPSTGFGGFGTAAAAPTAAPAFGASSTTGAFGSAAPAPATGGLFGSAPTPAPAFGVPAPAPTAFGAPAPAPSGGLFGAAPAPATGGLFGAPAAPVGGAAGQGVGSRVAPFQETRTQDGTSNISFQSITAMPQYGEKSFEELRMEDYMAGNKGMQGQPVAAPATGGFGAPAPAPALGGGLFGSTPTPAPSTGFGFGAPTPAPATGGLFGKPAAAPATGGLFGSTPAPAPAGGLFGSPAPAPAFGAAPAPAAGGFSFGATPAPAPATGGLFGAPAPAPASGGLFGAPAPATGGLFGSTPAPAPATGGLFGAPAPAPATGGLFGAPAPAPATGGLFGAPAPAPATGGLFGAPAPAPATGGLFGSPAPAPATSAFGAPATSAFGATSAPAAGGFSFGGGTPAPAPATGGLFGAPAPAVGGGLFGAKPATGGLFGSTTPAPAVPAPAVGGGFAPTIGVAGAAGQTTILVPPEAEQLLAQKMAAIQNQSKELEVLEAWRGGGPSPKKIGSNGKGNGKIVPTSISQRDAAAVRYRGLAGSTTSSLPATNGSMSNGILNSYHGAPRSAVKIRPRGFTPAKSSVGSFAGRSSKGMLSPSAFLGSATKNLVIKPDALAPKPKTRLLLSDDAEASSEKRDSSSSGGDHAAATPIVDLIKGPRNVDDTPTPSNGRKDQRDGHLPFENSIIVTEKPGFTSPDAVQETTASSSPTPKATPLPESSQKKKAATAETPTDESYDYYRSVIGSPSVPTNGKGNGFVSTPASETKTVSLPLPTLTKAGYAMTPSLEALSKMSEADLAAVPNFVVERVGIGSVAWAGAVDVRSIDLDSVVSIEPKAVEVYHAAEESGTKPDVGTKLNRPAIITLHDVYSKNGPEASTEEKAKFEKRIAKKTKEMGANFILMDTDIGVWKFQVEHFSRYALDDDSDDEEDGGNTGAMNQVGMSEEKMDFEEGVRGGRAPPVQQVPWAMMGGKTRFHVPDYDEDMDIGDENKLIVRNAEVNRIEAAESAYEQMALLETIQVQSDEGFREEVKSCYPDEGVICSDVFDNAITPPISVPVTNVNICAHIARKCNVKKATSSKTDFGMRMGRSFGVGWGPNGSFIHPADFKESRSTGEKFITQSKLFLGENTHTSMQDDLLSIHLKHIINVNQGDDCPIIAVAHTSVNKLTEDYIQGMKAKLAHLDNRSNTITSHAFSLISILFSQIPMKRKEQALAMWFRDICKVEVDHDITASQSAGNKYAEIFAALSGDDFSRASSIAMKHGHSMLALMIANASSAAGYLLSDQMKIWNDSGAVKDFPPELIRIYSLLTRNLELEEDLHRESTPATALDWKRRMAMLFRSIRGQAQNADAAIIPMLVEEYESEVEKGIAPPTQSWFFQPQRASGPTCTLFRILRAFTSLEKNGGKASLSTVISPSGHNPNQFDVSNSFHLASVVSSLGVCSNLSQAEECSLLDTFAAQLLSAGKWEWAVYVTLCSLNGNDLSSKMIATKKRMAKNIIDRHYTTSNDEDSRIRRSFLEGKVGVPSAWFEEALSNYAIHVGDVQSFLLHSTHLESNETLLRYEEALLPDALFNGDYHGIAEILDSMDGQGTIRTTLHGAVYEYLKLTNDFIELSKKGDSDGSASVALIEKAVRIQNDVKSLQGEAVQWKIFSGLPCVPKSVTLAELSGSLNHLIARLNEIRAGHCVAETTPGTLIAMKGASATRALSCSNDTFLFDELDSKSFLRTKYTIGETMEDIDDDVVYRPIRNYLG